MDCWTESVVAELAARILLMERRAQRDKRYLVGIAGGPAAGKSTLAALLVDQIDKVAGAEFAQILPMDGFHLRNSELDLREARFQKGNPDTFDIEAFVACLNRIKNGSVEEVPGYSRHTHDVVDCANRFSAGCRVAIVEGQFLYLNRGSWMAVLDFLDLKIFVASSEQSCARRLLARRTRTGMSTVEATRKIEDVEIPNYRLVQGTKSLADIVIASDGEICFP